MKKNKIPVFYNKEPIDFIEEFEKGTLTGRIKSRSPYINDIDKVLLKKERNEYSIEFDEFKVNNKQKEYELGKLIKKISFSSDKFNLVLENVFIGTFSTGYTSSVYKKGFNKLEKKYFKFIIPLTRKIDFHYQLSKYCFSSEFHQWSLNGTAINIEDEDIFILQENIKRNNDNSYYLIIESNKKQLYEEFADKVFAIRVSLGYIVGNFAGERGYFFSYNNKKREKFNSFLFHRLRGNIKNLYQPINSNAYAWLTSRNKKLAEKIYQTTDLRTLTKDEFSTLCKYTLENDNFLFILLLMLESSESSLLLRPGGYSIILEALSSIVIGEEEGKLNPITSKPESKKFRNQLLNVLKDYETNEHFKDIKTLKGRIDNINQVTNKEKLLLPFKLLKIDLLDEDIKIINSRNDFLHGRTPDYRELGESRSINEKDSDMFYASVRFYTLLNMLILKYIGYDNYVLNFAKIYEKDTGYLLREKYYRKV